MSPGELPLRDIHLPPPVAWWPPAPGWWLLLALGLATTVAIIVARRRRHYRAAVIRLRVTAGQEIETLARDFDRNGDADSLARGISALLRRICLTLHPRADVASLTGEAWLKLLDRQTGGDDFRHGHGRVLVTVPYRATATFDASALIELCRQFVRTLPAEVRN
jgi:hypothetical protein